MTNVCHPSLHASKWSQELRLSIADSLFDNSNEAICVTDSNESIVEVNPTLCQLSGYSREYLLGKTPRVLSSGLQNPAYFRAMWKSLLSSGEWHGEMWNRHSSGRLYAVRLNISAICNSAGELTHYLGIMADVTSKKLEQEELEKKANHDPLTGLPNRTLLMDRLNQAVAQSQRTGLSLAICFLDLDGFKPINDCHGHSVGDEVLREVARRLSISIRHGDTVARVGGDEFVILLWGLNDISECTQTLNRIIADIAPPIPVGDMQVAVTASIGASIFPLDGEDTMLLIAQADSAMYRSKLAGGNRMSYFSS